MSHSEEARTKGRAQRQFASDPIPAGLVGRWQIPGKPLMYEFTDEGTYANYFTLSDVDYTISSDGTTLTSEGTDYIRKFDTSTSLPGVWEGYHPVDDLYEEFNFHADGTYSTHWRPTNDDYFGSYLENTPTPGKLRLRELNSIVTIAGSQMTFDPPYMPSETGTFTLSGNTLSIDFSGTLVTYERVL